MRSWEGAVSGSPRAHPRKKRVRVSAVGYQGFEPGAPVRDLAALLEVAGYSTGPTRRLQPPYDAPGRAAGGAGTLSNAGLPGWLGGAGPPSSREKPARTSRIA